MEVICRLYVDVEVEELCRGEVEAVRHLTELSDIVFCGDGEDTFSPGAMVTQIKSKFGILSNQIYLHS